jgi:hypothetical protein
MDVLAAANLRCAHCRTTDASLDVHHKTYDRFGNERLDDLIALCRPCHDVVHAEKKARLEEEHYERRVDAWARKVYGDYGYGDGFGPDWDEVSEAFDDWLERRGYD